MVKHIRFLSLLALTLAGSASARIIVGGEVVKPGDPLAKFTVRIVNDRGTPGPGRYGMCTGTLITKNLVLTAAHCLTDGQHRFMKSEATLSVLFNDFEEEDLLPTEKNAISAIQIIVAGGYFGTTGVATDPNELNPFSQKDYDIGVLKLERNAPEGFGPIPLARAWEITDYAETLTVAGYGLEDEAPNAREGRLKTAQVDLKSLGNNWYYSRIESEFGTGNICSGDSGGPLLIKTPNEGYKLAGVNNLGVNGCIGGGRAVRVEDYTEFLSRAMRSMGHFEKPNFTARPKGKLERLREQLDEYLD